MTTALNWNEPIPKELIQKRGFLPNLTLSENGLSVVQLNDGDIVFDNIRGDNHTELVPEEKLAEIDWNEK